MIRRRGATDNEVPVDPNDIDKKFGLSSELEPK
jgi:hypothetical protein